MQETKLLLAQWYKTYRFDRYRASLKFNTPSCL